MENKEDVRKLGEAFAEHLRRYHWKTEAVSVEEDPKNKNAFAFKFEYTDEVDYLVVKSNYITLEDTEEIEITIWDHDKTPDVGNKYLLKDFIFILFENLYKLS